MKSSWLALSLAAACLTAATAQEPPHDPMHLFSGDTKLACEAIMCLSTSHHPEECEPSIRRYFQIERRNLSDQIDARRKFLRKCPDEKGQLTERTSAIAHGAGRCDAASLNRSLRHAVGTSDSETFEISNELPEYCTTYMDSSMSDLVAPVYVGEPDRDGYWVEADAYEEAQAAWEAAHPPEPITPLPPPSSDGA